MIAALISFLIALGVFAALNMPESPLRVTIFTLPQTLDLLVWVQFVGGVASVAMMIAVWRKFLPIRLGLLSVVPLSLSMLSALCIGELIMHDHAPADWTKTEGTVVAINYVEHSVMMADVQARVTVKYLADGKEMETQTPTSETIASIDKSLDWSKTVHKETADEYEKRQEMIAHQNEMLLTRSVYMIGDKVTVSYNPKNPQEMMLSTWRMRPNVITLFNLVAGILVFGCAGLAAAFSKFPKTKSAPTTDEQLD